MRIEAVNLGTVDNRRPSAAFFCTAAAGAHNSRKARLRHWKGISNSGCHSGTARLASAGEAAGPLHTPDIPTLDYQDSGGGAALVRVSPAGTTDPGRALRQLTALRPAIGHSQRL